MNVLKSLVRPISLVLLLVVLAANLLGYAPSVLADDASIVMGKTGLDFSPAEVSISPGDTVHFEVGIAGPHNVVFDPENSAGDVSSLSHPALAMSGGFDITFPADAATGTYSFYCEPHRGAPMTGKIIVQ